MGAHFNAKKTLIASKLSFEMRSSGFTDPSTDLLQQMTPLSLNCLSPVRNLLYQVKLSALQTT